MTQAWWQDGIIYQIYPRSFQDTNADGIGDLQGIRRRLDHLLRLGVDAIWISPVFPSPMADFGYDVSDYCGIDPIFGTLGDFDALVAEAKARGLRLILDFVPNHSSDQHPWFVESRASRQSPKRDWYIWRDPAPGGGPPNNWISNFGGSAWTWDEPSGQYYYHAFLREQPDLNWRNPQVRAAMYDALRFWMRRGVDGFRVDVLWHLIKDAALRDNPSDPDWEPGQPDAHSLLQVHSTDQPEVHEVVAQMRAVLDEFPDRVLIGEIYLPLDRLMAYYGADLSGAHLPFNFQLIATEWNAQAIAALVREYEGLLPPGGWPNWVLGNHDQSRVATRVGAAQARVAMMLLLTLRGTPTLYQGDELGLENAMIAPEDAQDPCGREPGTRSRDPERTPMPWDASPGSGFSDVKPWLPVGDANAMRHVAGQACDPGSLLSLTRDLIALRRSTPALTEGDIHAMGTEGDLLAFERRAGAQRILVVLNLGHGAAESDFEIPQGSALLLSTHGGRTEISATLRLAPDEGVILRLGPG